MKTDFQSKQCKLKHGEKQFNVLKEKINSESTAVKMVFKRDTKWNFPAAERHCTDEGYTTGKSTARGNVNQHRPQKQLSA